MQLGARGPLVTQNASTLLFVFSDKEFTVRLETDKRLYTVGEPVEFRCILEAQHVPDRYFAVSWAFNSSLIASMGPNAVPVLNSEFAHREARGQLKVAKEGDNVFVLKIYHLRQEDSGKYNCRVTEREKTVTGEFIDKESKRPKNIPIIVLPISKCREGPLPFPPPTGPVQELASSQGSLGRREELWGGQGRFNQLAEKTSYPPLLSPAHLPTLSTPPPLVGRASGVCLQAGRGPSRSEC